MMKYPFISIGLTIFVSQTLLAQQSSLEVQRPGRADKTFVSTDSQIALKRGQIGFGKEGQLKGLIESHEKKQDPKSFRSLDDLLKKTGGADPGGGDAKSEKAQEIVALIGLEKNESTPFESRFAQIKEKVNNALKVVSIFTPPGRTGALLGELVDRGILIDLREAKYVLTGFCEENGVEKSATTLDVNRTLDPLIPAPDICINVRKLAFENAEEKDIVGLLVHEHARHFGIKEDKNAVGIHPLALAIAASYTKLQAFEGVEKYAADGIFLKESMSDSGELKITLFAENPEQTSLSVDKVQGKSCEVAPYIGFELKKKDNWYEYHHQCYAPALCYLRDELMTDQSFVSNARLEKTENENFRYLNSIKVRSRSFPVMRMNMDQLKWPSDCKAQVTVSYKGQPLYRSTLIQADPKRQGHILTVDVVGRINYSQSKLAF